MSRPLFRPLSALLASVTLLSCAGSRSSPPPSPRPEVQEPQVESQSVKPVRPASNAGRPISDPPPSRIVIHTTVFREALTKKLAESIPRYGEGDAELFAGKALHYTWQREPVALRFDRGRVVVSVKVNGRFNMLGERFIPITLTIAGEPVMTPDFKALLQSSEVKVVATGPVDSVNRAIEEKLQELVSTALDTFRLDVRPLLASAFERIARPIEFPVGDQVACAELKVAALEAAPTVLADGLEKDLGIVVLPSVTLPCTPVDSLTASAHVADGGTPDADGGIALFASTSPSTDGGPPGTDGGTVAAAQATLPLLANVSTLPSGPFKVVVPVAARYEELSRVLESSMQGRLFFSTSHPELYLEEPEVYPSDDTVVIRMKLGGSAKVGAFSLPVGGELFFAGHPRVIDNQLTVPDLEITPGTASELVKLKFALDYESVRDQARSALRVDVSERLAAVKDKMSTELSFSEETGCVRAQVLRTEVTGIYPHPSFLRIYVQVDAQAGLYLPCKR